MNFQETEERVTKYSKPFHTIILDKSKQQNKKVINNFWTQNVHRISEKISINIVELHWKAHAFVRFLVEYREFLVNGISSILTFTCTQKSRAWAFIGILSPALRLDCSYGNHSSFIKCSCVQFQHKILFFFGCVFLCDFHHFKHSVCSRINCLLLPN